MLKTEKSYSRIDTLKIKTQSDLNKNADRNILEFLDFIH